MSLSGHPWRRPPPAAAALLAGSPVRPARSPSARVHRVPWRALRIMRREAVRRKNSSLSVERRNWNQQDDSLDTIGFALLVRLSRVRITHVHVCDHTRFPTEARRCPPPTQTKDSVHPLSRKGPCAIICTGARNAQPACAHCAVHAAPNRHTLVLLRLQLASELLIVHGLRAKVCVCVRVHGFKSNIPQARGSGCAFRQARMRTRSKAHFPRSGPFPSIVISTFSCICPPRHAPLSTRTGSKTPSSP